jgi:hypothetical protein
MTSSAILNVIGSRLKLLINRRLWDAGKALTFVLFLTLEINTESVPVILDTKLNVWASPNKISSE